MSVTISTDRFRFSDCELVSTDEYSELSAVWNGTRVYFRSIGLEITERRGEVFVATFLPLAMYLGQDLYLPDELPLSEGFVARLEMAQEIWARWCVGLKPVAVHAKIQESKAQFDGAVCSFSGGVDSCYTFLRHKDEITHLLSAQCFDFDRNNTQSWALSKVQRQKFATHYGKDLLQIETNVREVLTGNGVIWNVVFGSFIGSVGTLFGHKSNYISSGYPYDDLHPDGCHALLDPCWSTNRTAVVHVGGGQSRSEKTVSLTEDQFVMDNLQVCWRHSEHNCGHCPKCVRTGITLHLVGKSSANIPYQYQNKSSLKCLAPTARHELSFLDEIIELARKVGNDEVAGTLLKYRKRFMLRCASEEFLKGVLPVGISRRLRARQEWMRKKFPVSFVRPSNFL